VLSTTKDYFLSAEHEQYAGTFLKEKRTEISDANFSLSSDTRSRVADG